MKSLRFLIVAAVLTLGWTSAVHAAGDYPQKPVSIVIPYSAGGSTDLVFRVLAPALSKELGQSVIILNKPGGAGAIGINEVAKSAPDGYTLGVATLSFTANKYFLHNATLPYDPEKDLAAVSMVSQISMVVTVNKAVPVKSVKALIALSKEKPGTLNFGSSGVASDGELGAELFASMSGAKIAMIPYGSTGAVNAIVTNQVQVLIAPISSSLPFIKSGQLVPLGVTSLRPNPVLPGVPPVAAAVPGLEFYSFQGLVAPAGTPPAITARLAQAVRKALTDPAVKSGLADIGAEPVGDSPAHFSDFLKKQFATWASTAAKFQATATAQ